MLRLDGERIAEETGKETLIPQVEQELYITLTEKKAFSMKTIILSFGGKTRDLTLSLQGYNQ